jgi:hypothetical protein
MGSISTLIFMLLQEVRIDDNLSAVPVESKLVGD